jgi:AcrR family transcriptional regulator
LNKHSFFVPKIAQDRILENQRRIEAAALELFTRQGFHGTNIREIAERAQVSVGAIYTYYPTKEALYVTLVRNYKAHMEQLRDQMFSSLEDIFSKSDLKKFTSEIRGYVYNHAEFWLLMYIDAIEFKNQHFAEWFHNMPEQFRSRLGPVLSRAKRQPGWCGQDPAFAFATIYLYVITYFLIEKLLQGNHHLGVSDEQAMDKFIELLTDGLWSSREPRSQKSRSNGKAPPARRKMPRALAMSS